MLSILPKIIETVTCRCTIQQQRIQRLGLNMEPVPGSERNYRHRVMGHRSLTILQEPVLLPLPLPQLLLLLPLPLCNCSHTATTAATIATRNYSQYHYWHC